DLDEVVERLTPVREATGEVLGQRQVGGDEVVVQPLVTRARVLLEGASQLIAVAVVETHRRISTLSEPPASSRVGSWARRRVRHSRNRRRPTGGYGATAPAAPRRPANRRRDRSSGRCP